MTAPLAAAPLADVLGAGRPCPHTPPCPAADAVDHDAAVVTAEHHDQGWVRLCNGIIRFDDTGEILPDDGPTGCHAEPPHRGPAPHRYDKEIRVSSDEDTYDGPAILEGLRRSRAAHEAGDRDESLAIVERLRVQHGDEPVDAIIGALRLGFMTLDPVED